MFRMKLTCHEVVIGLISLASSPGLDAVSDNTTEGGPEAVFVAAVALVVVARSGKQKWPS